MKLLINGCTITESIKSKIETMNYRESLVLDAEIGYLKKYNYMEYKKLIVLVAVFVLSTTVNVFASANAFDAAGNALFNLVIGIGKWVFVSKGGWEIVQKIATGCEIGDIASVLTKYGLGYGGIVMLPKLLDMLYQAIDKVTL